jgi:hypothetical protein
MIRRSALAFSLLSSSLAVVLAESADVPLTNWTVPTYRASSSSGGLTTMTDVTPGIAFVGIQPCRVTDTRGNGAPITGGIFANSALRTWDLTGLCGLPAGTDAISANFTVVAAGGIPAGSFLLAWPTGQPPPPTAIMTYGPGQIISNAAIVPLGPGEQMTVNVSGSTHIVMDVNGYFTDAYNPDVSFHAVSSNAAPAILAENTSTVANAVAIQGVITSKSPGSGSAAVRGISDNNTNNNGIGVWGSHSGAGWGVLGTSQTGIGVIGQSFGSIGAGVYGQTLASSEDSVGVWGRYGSDQVPGTIPPAGVYGESTLVIGVLGRVSNPFGEAVAGYFLDTSGGVLSAGHLGYSSTVGVYYEQGLAGFGTKNFIEPHPTDASKVIRYVSLEGNEAGTYFRGRGKFQNGIAVIQVPTDFRMVTDPEGLSIQVTPIGQMATVAVETIGLERIVVRGSRNVEFFYTVNGQRRAYKNLPVIVQNEKFLVPESADGRIPRWLSEDERQRLITNGTYNADGTVNMETARRLGWDKRWAKRNRPVPQSASD